MSIDENIYNEMKDKLFEFFEDETLERIMDNIKEFTLKYIETNDCDFLINDIFSEKASEILNALNTSDYLGNMIVQGYISPEEISYMKPHEIKPEKYKNIIEKKAYEHNQKKKGSNIFSCKKCKQSNCEVTQKQTRAADEPATTFVKCLECGFSFRF